MWNDIKDGFKMTWFVLQFIALAISSICIIWVITQFMPSDWAGRCAVGIISLVSLIYMIKLLMQAMDFQKTITTLRMWSKISPLPLVIKDKIEEKTEIDDNKKGE